MLKWIVILCALLTALSLAYAIVAQSSGAFDQMTKIVLKHDVPELHAREDIDLTKYVILDTREKDEYEVSHLKNAIWVGYKDFNLSRVAHVQKNSAVLLYCSIGYRSEKIAKRMRAAGFTNVTNLVGGIFAWSNLDKPVYDSSGLTYKVHPYDAVWGLWLKRRPVTAP